MCYLEAKVVYFLFEINFLFNNITRIFKNLSVNFYLNIQNLVSKTETIPMLEKIECRRRRGTTEDEMVGWHHRLDGLEFEQAPGAGDGQGSLVCYTVHGVTKSQT